MTSNSTYPATLDTFNVALDGAKTLADPSQKHSEVHDWIGDAFNKIEATLGVNPQQAAATVAAFLAAIPGSKIADGTITGSKIAQGTIVSSNIAVSTITNTQIAAGAAIDATKLAGYPNDPQKRLCGDGQWRVN